MVTIPGMQPTREVVRDDGNRVVIKVTPPAFLKAPPAHVELTRDQYARYLEWRAGHKLIQEALPELTAADREILLSGIGPDAWDHLFPDDDECDDDDDP